MAAFQAEGATRERSPWRMCARSVQGTVERPDA